ncbi:MAG TPA: DedA family protein [Acidimicrobiales bacterium]|jgi:membrane protein DedA with SNARE-associated domain|nr:DedA family protein [Acidimicrobiales bacterium]
MSFFVDHLTHLAPAVVYAAVAALVFGEAALFVGFVLPGETAVLLGGFIASQGRINIAVLCVLVVAAAVVGDTVGYALGAHYGPRLLDGRILRKRRAAIDRALAGLEKNGATYVFLGRFTAFFRAVVPGLAGMSEMRYRRFLAANAAGGLCWGVGYALLGYFAGTGYKRVAHYSSFGALGLVGVIVLLAIGMHLRRRRRERREKAVAGDPAGDLSTPDEERDRGPGTPGAAPA